MLNKTDVRQTARMDEKIKLLLSLLSGAKKIK